MPSIPIPLPIIYHPVHDLWIGRVPEDALDTYILVPDLIAVDQALEEDPQAGLWAHFPWLAYLDLRQGDRVPNGNGFTGYLRVKSENARDLAEKLRLSLT